eukprot:5074465-Pyramimonas_sp.AAC.1
MRTLPLGPSVELPYHRVTKRTASGPSVELPMGPRSVVLGGGNAWGYRHSGPRWSSLWGHEALYS